MSTKKTNMENAIMSALHDRVKEITTLQESIHKTVLFETARYVFIYKDCTIVEKVLNALTEQKGFRVEAAAYWLKDIAGIPCDYNDTKKWHGAHLARDEYKSNNGIEFTYDKVHLDWCRKESYRFWKIAPVTIKELKLADLEKTTSSAEIQLARLLSVGALSEQEVVSYLSGMMDRVKDALNSKSVKKWTSEYIAQSKQEPSEIEAELQETFQADLLEA